MNILFYVTVQNTLLIKLLLRMKISIILNCSLVHLHIYLITKTVKTVLLRLKITFNLKYNFCSIKAEFSPQHSVSDDLSEITFLMYISISKNLHPDT